MKRWAWQRRSDGLPGSQSVDEVKSPHFCRGIHLTHNSHFLHLSQHPRIMSNSKDEPSLPHQLLLKTETHYEFIVRPNAEKAPGLTIESVLKIKRNSNDLSVDTDDSLNLPIYQHMVNDNKWNLSRGPKSKAAETDDSWGKIPPVRPVECDSLEHSFAERAMDACVCYII